MIDQLSATLSVDGGDPIDVTDSLTVTLDQGWAPYITAQVAFPATDELFDACDPRSMVRGVLTIRQEWAPDLADLSAAWAGLTLADLSTVWTGLTLGDLSNLYGWGNTEYRAPATLTLDVGLRRRSRDYVDDMLTLMFMSDERLAQETFPGEEHRAEEALGFRMSTLLAHLGADVPVTIGLSTTMDPLGDYYTTVPAMDLSWTTSVWDAIAQSASAVGLRLWCDEARVWQARNATAAPTTTVHIARVIAAEDDTDRDGEWADAYRHVTVGTNDGAPYVDVWDVPDPPSTNHTRRKVYTQQVGEIAELDPPYLVSQIPDPVSAAARAASQGRVLVLTAPVDLAVRPGVGITTGLPSLPSLAGQVDSVRFDIGAAVMTITTRDTVTGA